MSGICALSNFFVRNARTLAGRSKKTLRHDYGPELSAEFYEECARRLDKIKKQVQPGAISDTDRVGIAALLADLGNLANLIVLIERSHLGEFSGPLLMSFGYLQKKY